MPPAPSPFVVLRLKPGWTFDVDTAVATRRGSRVQLLLPGGARLRAALALPPAARRRRTAAERELARYLHLWPPDGMAPQALVRLVRDWVFVESAELRLDGDV